MNCNKLRKRFVLTQPNSNSNLTLSKQFQLQQYKSGNYVSNQNETKENGEIDKESNKNGEVNLQQEVAEYQAKTHELQTIIEKQVNIFGD